MSAWLSNSEPSDMAIMSVPVLHIHPTRMCNLACIHCYSTSGPKQQHHLAAEEILAASAGLKELGYLQASLSGGEPMLYPHRETLALGLKAQGYRVSVITNGWFADRITTLCAKDAVDDVSVSFDGLPCVHDKVRARKGAFDKAISCLRALRDMGQPVGAIVAVTRASMPQLPDLVDLLVKEGVASVQFHPVAEVGRARETPECTALSGEQLLRLLLLTRAFGDLYPQTRFSSDALTGNDIADAKLGDVGDLISPLIISETGDVQPLSYGVESALHLGNLKQGFRAPFVDDALSEVIRRAQRRSGAEIASAFFPEILAEAAGQPAL